MYYEWLHQGFNIFNTGLPIVFGGALDQDVSKEQALKNPRLYEDGRKGRFFTVPLFWSHVLGGRTRTHSLRNCCSHLGLPVSVAIAMGNLLAENQRGRLTWGPAQ